MRKVELRMNELEKIKLSRSLWKSVYTKIKSPKLNSNLVLNIFNWQCDHIFSQIHLSIVLT